VTAPRLVGPRVALLPVPAGVAEAVASADAGALDVALRAAALRAAAGWPHDDTAALLAGAAHADAGEQRTWLVAVSDEVVGECGWKGPPETDGTVELGYGIAGPARGDGLGTEAVAVLVAWSTGQPGVRALAADVLVGNEASRRLLRRLGFEERRVDGRYVRAERGRPRIRGRHVC
jgi:RimJ/RimL family protein N-acetyltransferase